MNKGLLTIVRRFHAPGLDKFSDFGKFRFKNLAKISENVRDWPAKSIDSLSGLLFYSLAHLLACKELSACEYRIYNCQSEQCYGEDRETPVTFKYSYIPDSNTFTCRADLSCAQAVCECQLGWAAQVICQRCNTTVSPKNPLFLKIRPYYTSFPALLGRDDGTVVSEHFDVVASECEPETTTPSPTSASTAAADFDVVVIPRFELIN